METLTSTATVLRDGARVRTKDGIYTGTVDDPFAGVLRTFVTVRLDGYGLMRVRQDRLEVVPEDTIRVLSSGSRQGRTTYVEVTDPHGATDAELADAAGYCSSHFGFAVTRHNDGTATVALWND